MAKVPTDTNISTSYDPIRYCWSRPLLLLTRFSVTFYIVLHPGSSYLWANLRKGITSCKTWFLSLFNLPPFQASKSPRLQTWFVGSLGLLLHRSNVRSLSKPPVPSGEPPNRGMKRPVSRRGLQIAATVVGWWKNINARVPELWAF